MQLKAKIESTRLKLMYVIMSWLVLARLCAWRGNKPLPKRLGRYVASQLYKAELAAHHLAFVVFRIFGADHRALAPKPAMPSDEETLTIPTIIQRLKRLQMIDRTLGNTSSMRKKIITNSRINRLSGHISAAREFSNTLTAKSAEPLVPP